MVIARIIFKNFIVTDAKKIEKIHIDFKKSANTLEILKIQIPDCLLKNYFLSICA